MVDIAAEIVLKDKTFVPHIRREVIEKAINEVAVKINRDYKGKNPIFLAVLNGSFMFASDLMKQIDMTCEISFVKLASYEGTKTTGKVNQLIGINESIKGRDVVIIEDIVDTGNTLEKLNAILEDMEVNSVEVATLLYKPESHTKSQKINYIGLEIPNQFVVGYGLDYDGLGRNIPSIYILKD